MQGLMVLDDCRNGTCMHDASSSKRLNTTCTVDPLFDCIERYSGMFGRLDDYLLNCAVFS